MINRLQHFFARQTPVARLIAAIAGPLILFIVAYAWAQEIVYDNEPFDFNNTGLVWILFVSSVSLLEYCIWQPVEKK